MGGRKREGGGDGERGRGADRPREERGGGEENYVMDHS